MFTRILPKPFKYPYPSVNLLPNEEEYLNAPFPVVYGMIISKKQLLSANLHTKYQNTYIHLSNDGAEIIYSSSKKKLLKNVPLKTNELLKSMFPKLNGIKRQSSIKVESDNYIHNSKDKQGITTQILE